IKPKEPAVYDGEDDYTRFQKFVYDCVGYMREGRVPANEQVWHLRNSVSGKALELYTREVVTSHRRTPLSLDNFLTKLFKHCFSPHFKTEMKTKLLRLRQNGREVRDFTTEIQDLSKLVGGIDEEIQRSILWQGADSYIVREWKAKGYDPST
ncbi:hypothetical protein SISNIDRAFT_392605, partial [Sistotremastrum niveocremeum HHB9708]